MSTTTANAVSFFNKMSVGILRLLRYYVPANQRNQGFIKAVFSYVIPTITAIISFCMLEVAMLVFFADIIGLTFQFFISVFSYQSYRRSFEKESSVATSLHETPLLIRTVTLLVLIGTIIIIVFLAIVIPTVVTFDSAWAICACINIIVTWSFEIVDSLVAIYGAEIESNSTF